MAANASRPRAMVWPIILIAVGVVLLLQNLGLLPWGFWELAGRFWPLVLILIGIELLLSRRNPWLATGIAAGLLLVFIGVGVVLAQMGYGAPRWVGSSEERLSEPLGQAERATVDLQFGAGDLVVGSLEGESSNLVEGNVTHRDGTALDRSYNCRNGDCTLRLSPRGRDGWPFGGRVAERWDLMLTPRIPLNLRVKTGASRNTLDLSGLHVTSLNMDLGAGNATLTLPAAAGAVTAVVKAGAADLDVVVPPETAARISTRGGLSTFQVDETRFPRTDDSYVSPGYATATNRIDLQIEAGVASVRVR